MTTTHIIGLMGPAGAGKDTAADHLEAVHGFVRYAFADPMRTMLEAMLVDAGLDYAYIHEPSLKEQPIPGIGFSYRHLAQTLGTEWGRNQVAPDFWLRLAALNLGLPNEPIHDRIVITDVRFPNEAAWLKQHGGLVLRIQRDTAPVRSHISEQLMASIEPWSCVENNGAVEDLHAQLDALLSCLPISQA